MVGMIGYDLFLEMETDGGKRVSVPIASHWTSFLHGIFQVIYIAPLKALVKERMDGWGKGLVKTLGKKMVAVRIPSFDILWSFRYSS